MSIEPSENRTRGLPGKRKRVLIHCKRYVEGIAVRSMKNTNHGRSEMETSRTMTKGVSGKDRKKVRQCDKKGTAGPAGTTSRELMQDVAGPARDASETVNFL